MLNLNINKKHLLYSYVPTQTTLIWFNKELVQKKVTIFADYTQLSICVDFLDVGSYVGASVRVPPLITFFFCNQIILFNMFYYNHWSSYFSIVNLSLNFWRESFISINFGWYGIIQFFGFRFRQRWFRAKQVLRYRFGYNKKVWFKCPETFAIGIRKISPKKRTHYLFTFDRLVLRSLIFRINAARQSTKYKGRGVNLREQPMVLKEGKKSNW